MKRILFLFVAFCVATALAPVGLAGPGHDHSHDHAVPTATGPALPRFTAQSDLFDAVGILGKEELVVFVDRAATNEPVLNATVELESGSIKAIGKFEATLGEYHFDGTPFQQTAVYPITLTIKAGSDTDLLSADLDVHGDESVAKAANALPHTFREHPVWVGAGLFVIILLVGIFIWSFKRTPVFGRRDRSAA
jgi:hypothetical protein